MKKRVLSLLVLCFWFLFLFQSVFAISSGLKMILDQLGEKMTQKYTVSEQIQKYTSISKTFKQTCPFVKERTKKENCEYIVEWMEQKISEVKKLPTKSFSDETASHISNVNMEKVRDAWIQWHNDHRKQLWLHNYQENAKLNHSAFVWAKHMASLGTWTHKRKASDGFYNYFSLKEWFANQGVYFQGKWTLFTESVGLRGYSCSKTDCTNELISAIKKTFTFFMSEKNANGPHYRAIAHKYFDQIWLGLYLKGGRYYLVSHYGMGVK